MSMIEIVSESGDEPVGLTEAKLHMRMDDIDDEDILILSQIAAARQLAEQHTNRDIVQRTWDYRLNGFPQDRIELPKAPVQSISSISYIDTNGGTQTVAGSVYSLYADDTHAFAYLNHGQAWPQAREQVGAVTVRLVTGYESAPAPIVQAIKMMLTDLYNHRGSTIATGAVPKELPMSARYLLAPYRRLRA